MSGENKNQGEGNREAAKEYNEKTEQFVETQDVDAKAQEAREAVSGAEGDELKKAEEKGKGRAKEFDPQVKRDR